jgi:5-methylcytosine-specific restriction endonuclease McrA
VDYRRGVITQESVWRAIVLYGANSATYKFAFGSTLLEVAARGQTHVTVEELAPRYAELLCAAQERQSRQATAANSRFLDACRAFNSGDIDRDTLHRRTAQLGFANVIAAFPRLAGSEAPIRFYEDQRRSSVRPGLVIRDELLTLAGSHHAAELSAETDARWRLVETAWATGLADGLLTPPLGYDRLNNLLVLPGKLRRKNVTGVVPALNGYQDGRCAYCNRPMSKLGSPVVEHVLPWLLLTRTWLGPDLDAVWNLVLACWPCNSAKQGRAPAETWMPWLEQRNEDLIASQHPLRETLLSQTGPTAEARHTMLRHTYRHATELLPQVWLPPEHSDSVAPPGAAARHPGRANRLSTGIGIDV